MLNQNIKIPKTLVHDKNYRGLNSTAILFYGILYTKLCDKYIMEASSLYVSKGYDDIYITFANTEIAQFLNTSEFRIPKLKKELIQCNLLKIEKKPYHLDKLYLNII